MTNSFSVIYQQKSRESLSKPIKNYVQVFNLIIYSATGIVIVAILLGRSPLGFLTGLGAATATLMLVFRNTMASLAASILITNNDLIRVGDWVEIPQADADGTVVDIDLHQIKVQNWDKSISTIANQKFISESFKNWRGMSESGGRRIKRAILIDINTVHFLTGVEMDVLSQQTSLHGHLQDELDRMKSIASCADGLGSTRPVQPVTNLEMYRVYVVDICGRIPNTPGDAAQVRHLAPGPHGASLEIYCFSNDTDLLGYEAFHLKSLTISSRFCQNFDCGHSRNGQVTVRKRGRLPLSWLTELQQTPESAA